MRRLSECIKSSCGLSQTSVASLVSEHSPSGETFSHVLTLYSREVPPPLTPGRPGPAPTTRPPRWVHTKGTGGLPSPSQKTAYRQRSLNADFPLYLNFFKGHLKMTLECLKPTPHCKSTILQFKKKKTLEEIGLVIWKRYVYKKSYSKVVLNE